MSEITPSAWWIQRWPTGSAYIGTDRDAQDIDYLEFVHSRDIETRQEELEVDGWEKCGMGYTKEDADKWCAYRRGDWNVILCWCPLVYLRWVAFTELARRATFTSKVERIELCKAILEGNDIAAMNIVHLSDFNIVAGNIFEEYKADFT